MPIETPAGTLEVENAKFRASSVEATIAVGIGTESNDAYPLQVFKETSPDIRLSEGSTISSAARFYSNNSNLYIQTGTNFTSGSSGDIAFQTMAGQSTHMMIKSDGKVGVGTTNPALNLHVMGAIMAQNNGTITPQIQFKSGNSNTNGWLVRANISDTYAGDFTIDRQDNSVTPSKFVIKNNGNVGIGATNPGAKLDVFSSSTDPGAVPTLHVGDGTVDYGDYGMLQLTRSPSAGGSKAHAAFIRSGNTIFSMGYYNNTNTFGLWPSFSTVTNTPAMAFATDGNVGIGITNPLFKLDILGGSTAGTRDIPLRLIGDGSDIVPLINAGTGGESIKTIAGLEITSVDATLSLHGRHSYIESVSAGSTYNTDLEFRARTTDANYQYGGSSNPTTKQARISHNGYIYARVGTSGTGADYAELFEWDDGNQGDEDRTGMTVKLTTGGKIAIADTAENVIGVVSVIYGFLGNDQWDEWVGKYVKDSLGRTINEDVKMVTWRDENDKECTFKITHVPNDITIPENAVYYTHQSPKINPEYDETKNYVGRSQRKEWSAIGLVGRLRILKGYPKSPRWIKIQDIDENVEEYLAV